MHQDYQFEVRVQQTRNLAGQLQQSGLNQQQHNQSRQLQANQQHQTSSRPVKHVDATKARHSRSRHLSLGASLNQIEERAHQQINPDSQPLVEARLYPKPHYYRSSTTAINLAGTSHGSGSSINSAGERAHEDRNHSLVFSSSQQYSSSQAQLQSLTSRQTSEVSPNNRSSMGGTLRKSHSHRSHRVNMEQPPSMSQLPAPSISSQQPQTRLQQSSTSTKQMIATPVATLNEPSRHPRQQHPTLPPPYSMDIGRPNVISQQPQSRLGQLAADVQVFEAAQVNAVRAQTPTSTMTTTPHLNPATRHFGQVSSSGLAVQQQPHVNAVGLSSSSSNNQQNGYSTSGSVGINSNANFPVSLNQQQQYPHFLHPHNLMAGDQFGCLPSSRQQSASSSGVSKSKSCLTCADISIKWYIVVIALLGLICALIGTIVGAVHSAGRDYISLALLLIGKYLSIDSVPDPTRELSAKS